MNQRLQPKPAPVSAARPAASTPAEIRKLAEDLMDVMSALLGVIDRETELVRAGDVREAIRLEEQKSELSRRYMTSVANIQAAQKLLAQAAPELLATLRRNHDTFRAMLQVNLPVRDRARGIQRHRARRQHRNPAPQHSEHLHSGRPACRAGPAPHHAARGQPLALSVTGPCILSKIVAGALARYSARSLTPC
jgi:hypothetical protein